MVMTYDSISYSNQCGMTSHHPKHSKAFKWGDEEQVTTLRDIQVDVGKSGQISYTAMFDPVELEGTTVERASLHNYEYIRVLELGIGDQITIIKANQIIPQVINSLTKSNTYKKATHCPICGGKLINKDNGVHQFCTNYHCDRQVVGRLVHWCSRDAMDIKGMSEETIKAIRTVKTSTGGSILQNISDLYYLKECKHSLLQLERFGKKKVDKMLDEIELSKNKPLANVIYGLAIPQVGHKASKTLAENFESMEALIKRDCTIRYIQDLVGNSVTESLYTNFYSNEDLTNVIDLLFKHKLTMLQPISTIGNSLEDNTFVVTGKVYQFSNRKELESKIEELGGKVSKSVSKTLHT